MTTAESLSLLGLLIAVLALWGEHERKLFLFKMQDCDYMILTICFGLICFLGFFDLILKRHLFFYSFVNDSYPTKENWNFVIVLFVSIRTFWIFRFRLLPIDDEESLVKKFKPVLVRREYGVLIDLHTRFIEGRIENKDGIHQYYDKILFHPAFLEHCAKNNHYFIEFEFMKVAENPSFEMSDLPRRIIQYYKQRIASANDELTNDILTSSLNHYHDIYLKNESLEENYSIYLPLFSINLLEKTNFGYEFLHHFYSKLEDNMLPQILSKTYTGMEQTPDAQIMKTEVGLLSIFYMNVIVSHIHENTHRTLYSNIGQLCENLAEKSIYYEGYYEFRINGLGNLLIHDLLYKILAPLRSCPREHLQIYPTVASAYFLPLNVIISNMNIDEFTKIKLVKNLFVKIADRYNELDDDQKNQVKNIVACDANLIDYRIAHGVFSRFNEPHYAENREGLDMLKEVYGLQ